MSAQQSHHRNPINIKTVCLYGVLTAVCLVLGFLESLLPADFIAPGIKLGLANSVALLLLLRDRTTGAFAVNMTRILLSAMLFGSSISLLFSLTGGIASLGMTILLKRTDWFSSVGLSVAGAVTHNIAQTLVAVAFYGKGVWLYLPLLLAAGTVSGVLVGLLCAIILKKMETNRKK